jgi:hypothetical protein
MKSKLDSLRLSVAKTEFDRFDFGTPDWRAGAWEEDVTNTLTCIATHNEGGGRRTLMFRVHFCPGTIEVRDLEVAERLLLV